MTTKKRSLTAAVLTAIGLDEKTRAEAREVAALTKAYARKHGWRATLAAFIAGEP